MTDINIQPKELDKIIPDHSGRASITSDQIINLGAETGRITIKGDLDELQRRI